MVAKITDLEAAEADALIVEIAGTVCAGDPRSAGVLRAAALMALLHAEHALACECGRGEGCPVAGVVDDVQPRRGHLLQIVVTVETLLGLSSEPAVLADGTPIAPEVARIVAADAKWQAILIEMVEILKQQEGNGGDGVDGSDVPPNNNGDNGSEGGIGDAGDGCPDGAGDGGPDDAGAGGVGDAGPGGAEDGDPVDGDPSDVGPQGGDDDGSAEGGPGGGPGGNAGAAGAGAGGPGDTVGGVDPGTVLPPWQRASGLSSLSRRILGRGRIRAPAQLPAASGCPPASGPTSWFVGDDCARAQLEARWLGWITEDPGRAVGLFPDGHGGLRAPPKGALTYRPSAQVAASVRAAYRTCTFANCDVPSAKCQLDHIVPFDRLVPERGGWTIVSNVQPVCVFHHQAKTAKTWSAVMLAGGAIVWSNSVGIRTVSLPDFAIAVPSGTRLRRSAPTRPPPDPTVPTRWEETCEGEEPPRIADIVAASSDSERKRLIVKRRDYREHCRTMHYRSRSEPAPF